MRERPWISWIVFVFHDVSFVFGSFIETYDNVDSFDQWSKDFKKQLSVSLQTT